MPVEFSQVLRVLAHEIRGPLGILQGYLRLLKDGRLERDATERTVTAMLDATGRLSTLTRQVSDLIPWYESAPRRDMRPLSVRVLVDQTMAVLDTTCDTSVRVPDDVADWLVRTGAGQALPAALAAVIDWTCRQSSGTVSLIGAIDPVKSILTLTIGPAEPIDGAVHDRAPGDQPASDDHPSPFAAGGHGLALVLAGVVLESHGAEVRADDRQLVIRIPAFRGV